MPAGQNGQSVRRPRRRSKQWAVDVHGPVVARAREKRAFVADDVWPPGDGVDGALSVPAEDLEQLTRVPVPDVDV